MWQHVIRSTASNNTITSIISFQNNEDHFLNHRLSVSSTRILRLLNMRWLVTNNEHIPTVSFEALNLEF